MRGGGKERRKKKEKLLVKKNVETRNKELMFLEAVSKEGVKSTFFGSFAKFSNLQEQKKV
jgi:hypothetical protein